MSNNYLIDRPKVSNASLMILRRLGRTLVRDQPPNPSAVVKKSLSQLEGVLKVVDEALMIRYLETNPKLLSSDRAFDRSVDIFWIWLRKLLAGTRDTYGHPGLSALPDSLAEQLGLAKLRAKGELAGELHDLLFGVEGTAWVKRNWMTQSETMATILRTIKAKGLDAQLAEVGADELVAALEGLQVHYEAVVARRMSTSEGERSDDFNELRARLRWHLTHYQSALETMCDPDVPESFEVVAKAGRSIGLLAARMNAAKSTSELDELLDEDEFEPSLDPEVELDEDALDEQLDE